MTTTVTDTTVASSDPAVPTARVAAGDHPAAICPTCDARIYLRDTSEPGIDYQIHYTTEHRPTTGAERRLRRDATRDRLRKART